MFLLPSKQPSHQPGGPRNQQMFSFEMTVSGWPRNPSYMSAWNASYENTMNILYPKALTCVWIAHCTLTYPMLPQLKDTLTCSGHLSGLHSRLPEGGRSFCGTHTTHKFSWHLPKEPGVNPGSCFTFSLHGGQFCISNQYWDIREILTNISAECPNWRASEGLPRSNSFVCLPQGATQMCYFFLCVPRTRKSWETLSLVHIQSTSLELWLSSWDSLSRTYSTTFLKQMVSASPTSWLNIVHSPCSLNTHRGKNPRANIFDCTALCHLLRYGILQQPPEGTIIIILILKITNFPKVIQVISGELGFESRRPDLRALGSSKC